MCADTSVAGLRCSPSALPYSLPNSSALAFLRERLHVCGRGRTRLRSVPEPVKAAFPLPSVRKRERKNWTGYCGSNPSGVLVPQAGQRRGFLNANRSQRLGVNSQRMKNRRRDLRGCHRSSDHATVQTRPRHDQSNVGIAITEAADRKSTRLNSSHVSLSRMPSSA